MKDKRIIIGLTALTIFLLSVFAYMLIVIVSDKYQLTKPTEKICTVKILLKNKSTQIIQTNFEVYYENLEVYYHSYRRHGKHHHSEKKVIFDNRNDVINKITINCN